MKTKVKLALLSVSAGLIAFQFNAGCFWKWLGDLSADVLWLRAID